MKQPFLTGKTGAGQPPQKQSQEQIDADLEKLQSANVTGHFKQGAPGSKLNDSHSPKSVNKKPQFKLSNQNETTFAPSKEQQQLAAPLTQINPMQLRELAGNQSLPLSP